MAQPGRTEESPPVPTRPVQETASSVDDCTAGAPSSSHGEETFDFLDKPQAADELGRLAHYRVVKELGRGGMGCVLLAEDTKLERKVALKVMLPQHAKNPTARERFLREARAAAKIKHDHVITIFQVDEANGVPFIALEYLEGAPLDKYLKDKGALPLPLGVRIAREMAAGLQAAHKQGLIHRDIKPGNVWLEAPKGRVKLLDFGLARAEQEDTHLTQSGAIVGTPAFMAPEQARGEKVDGRCDLWSLGVVLYRLCTGKQPFAGPTAMSVLTAIAVDTPPSARSVNPNLPEALEKIIHRLLEKDPAKRYASAQEVIAELNGVAKALTEQRVGSASDGSKSPGAPTTAEPRPSESKESSEAKDAPQALPEIAGARLPTPLSEGRGSVRRRLALMLGLGGALTAVILLGLVIFWPTPRGTVRLESDDPDVEIVFGKDGPTIKGADKEPISLRSGEHGILVRRGDFTFETDKLVLKKGETITLKVELVGNKLQLLKGGQLLSAREVPLAKTFTNSLSMEFVLVPKGKFSMGGSGGNPGDKEVEIPHDFYLGKYEVTQEEWEKVTGLNPSRFKAVDGVKPEDQKRFPVEQVSWEDCQEFVKVLNAKMKEPGWVYRLPTEAEWEYACRGGPSSNKFDYGFDFYFEKPSLQLLPDQANCNNILKRTCKVGSYQPNKLGLYDMHGNVWEWCDDELKDDKGPSQRVNRGGCWGYVSGDCRAANCYAHAPSARSIALGMRLARIPVGKEPVVPKPAEPKKAVAPASDFTNSLGMEFVKVPKGKFWMGGTGGKVGDNEVEIPHDFYLGKYEVTQEEWQKVTGLNPSRFKAVEGVKPEIQKRFPVEQLSWGDCQDYVEMLNAKVKEPGWVYRLPTEAEWEYAFRGGPSSNKSDYGFDFYFEKPSLQLQPDQANFNHILKRTCKVGSYQPNKLGLYDMHGNVWEWCDDERKDDKGASRRVNRGGCWGNVSGYCRAAYRVANAPSYRDYILGMRLARVPVGAADLPKKPPTKPPEPKKAELAATFKNSLGMEFVKVPKGKFWMGGSGGNVGDKEVEIPHDFYLGKYEVTQEEWEKVTGWNPSQFARAGVDKKVVKDIADAELKRFPVENVFWDDCQEFLKLLNDRAKETGWVYRLPTEAEWEFACRGGAGRPTGEYSFDYYFELPTNLLKPDSANVKESGKQRTCQVGTHQPNRLGLFDMHGNVWEWCDDVGPADPKNPKGIPTQRVSRGGGWFSTGASCRAAHSYAVAPTYRSASLGLRLARIPVGKE